MAVDIYTYNPKQVSLTLGSHLVSGFADDSFISIDPNGDGVTVKVGCDGEIVRSIGPDDSYVLKVSLLQTSPTNAWLQSKFDEDMEDGDGIFPVLMKDLKGDVKFSAAYGWVSKPASRGYGKESANREWEIHTTSGTYTE